MKFFDSAVSITSSATAGPSRRHVFCLVFALPPLHVLNSFIFSAALLNFPIIFIKMAFASRFDNSSSSSLWSEIPTQLPPVIIHLESGNKVSVFSWSQMDAFSKSIVDKVGFTGNTRLLDGGDLSVYPVDKAQSEKLLGITEINSLKVVCSLPKSSSALQGIIERVPTNYTEDDIRSGLVGQKVVKIERFKKQPSSSGIRENTGFVLLTFEDKIPHDVKIGHLNFQVEKFFPSPYRCTNCLRVGHRADKDGNCRQRAQIVPALCKTCGKSHDATDTCSAFCVNCLSTEHNSLSRFCPIFVEMKAAIKLSHQENISIKQAMASIGTSFSSVLKKNPSSNSFQERALSQRSSGAPVALDTAIKISTMQKQINELQAALETLKSKTIPELEQSAQKTQNTFFDTLEEIGAQFDQVESTIADLDSRVTSNDSVINGKLDLIIASLKLPTLTAATAIVHSNDSSLMDTSASGASTDPTPKSPVTGSTTKTRFKGLAPRPTRLAPYNKNDVQNK